jgi:hypothetical protein
VPWLPLEWVATPFRACSSVRPKTAFDAPARLEGAGLLQVLAFEEQFGPGQLVQHARGHHRRAVNMGPDAHLGR